MFNLIDTLPWCLTDTHSHVLSERCPTQTSVCIECDDCYFTAVMLSMHSDELWACNPRTCTHFGLGRMRGAGQLEGPLTVQDVLIKAAVKCKLAANYDYL